MFALRPHLDKAHVVLGYLLVVLGASAAGGARLGHVVAALAFVAFDFLFLPPYYTLVVANPLDWLILVSFLIVSAVAAQLLARAQATAAEATARAGELDHLAALGAETLGAAGATEALAAIAAVVHQALDVDACEVYRRDPDGDLRLAVSRPSGAEAGRAAPLPEGLLRWLQQGERSALELVDGTVRLPGAPGEGHAAAATGAATGAGSVMPSLSSGASGAGTEAQLAALRFVMRDDAPSSFPRRHAPPGDSAGGGATRARALLLPLVARGQTVGMLRVVDGAGLTLASAQARLLVAMAYYAALALERARLVESVEHAEAERRLEALRSALLTAVSHDLRTPLTTIKALAHELTQGAPRDRAAVIEAEADWMNALVGDLLDLSRIQAGAVQADVAVNTADDLVGVALQRAAGALRAHRVDVELADDPLLAGRFDLSQTIRVLVNLLENAAKYAPPGSAIVVRAGRDNGHFVVDVLDRGPGVPDAERERIFEPFYRPVGTPPDVRGTGLGLSIARGLTEAQGGRLRYAPRPGGGAMFTIVLPAADVPADVVADVVADAGPTHDSDDGA
jgi:two-component system sensor histidine kinase KdpD